MEIEKILTDYKGISWELGVCPVCHSNLVGIMEEPYCGVHTSGLYVECSDCGLRTAAWGSVSVAIDHWNFRKEGSGNNIKKTSS